jgi:hypothetical protein
MRSIKKHITIINQLPETSRCLGVWGYAGTNYNFIDKRLL